MELEQTAGTPDITNQRETVNIEDEATNFARRCKNNMDFRNLFLFFLFTCGSLASYIFDMFSDAYWLYKFATEQNYLYFGFTSACLVCTTVIIVSRSNLLYKKKEAKKTYDPRNFLPEQESKFISVFIKPLFRYFSLIPRYLDLIKYSFKSILAKKRVDNGWDVYIVAMLWEDGELIILRQWESFMEQAPQLLLSLCRLVRRESKLDAFFIFPIFSICSLALGLVSYDQKICLVSGIDREEGNLQTISVPINFHNNVAIDCIQNLTFQKSSFDFIRDLIWLVGRYITLTFLAASDYVWLFWTITIAHFIYVFSWHREKNYSFMDSLRFSFVHVFACLYPLEKASDRERHPRLSPFNFLNLCTAENLVIWVNIFWFNHESLLEWTFIVPVIGGCFTISSNYFFLWLVNKGQQH